MGQFLSPTTRALSAGMGRPGDHTGVFLDIMKGIWADLEDGQDDFMGRLDEAKCW